MRKRVINAGVTINAVAGCHVVMLGLDIVPAQLPGLLGFAIRRHDPAEGEVFWMKGAKTFQTVEPFPTAGEQFSSLFHPFQTFQWADYSAKPDRDYTYDVVAMYGAPAALVQGATASVTVHTEPVSGVDHTVLFNRGSVATQEYARRFQNQWPSVAGPGAYQWLSRGLLEGVIAFIERATGPGWGLKGCFYEFQWPAVLLALKAARTRGASVKIVYDDIESDTGPWEKNEAAIETAQIKTITKARERGTLMHNKFLVLTHNGAAVALLFGSTNMTENGIFGHANLVHIVEDPVVAAAYLTYFNKLHTDPDPDPDVSTYKTWTIQQTPAPTPIAAGQMKPVFSPRSSINALQWYADMADGAQRGLFMTFAFGMNERFRNVYAKDDAILRMGLMEKEWNGKNKEAQIAAIRALQARANVVIAIGNRIPLSGFDQWLGELERITQHVNVHWIHTKFMLVDPLSDDPMVVTGSANFSDASTRTNDENMLVIKGSTRVADIYLGEFMRLHSHYAFRQAVGIFLEKNPGATPEDFARRFLDETPGWTADYFNPGDRNARCVRRVYFAG